MFEIIIISGVILSFIYYEITGFFPGGIIVPGYLVYYFDDPQRIILTLIIALISYLLVYKVLSRYIIIYGVRRFFLMILTAYFIGLTFDKFLIIYYPEIIIAPIGFLIAGIIANNFIKQGIYQTFIHTFTAILFLKLIFISLGIS